MKKKIFRNKAGAMMSGVCNGLADYLETDVTLIRLGWVALSLFTTVFPGVILYIICACVIPEAE
jgi:phage shock protein C